MVRSHGYGSRYAAYVQAQPLLWQFHPDPAQVSGAAGNGLAHADMGWLG
jgi:hypothetical protein